MANKNILFAYIGLDIVFLLTGGLLLGFALISTEDLTPGVESTTGNTIRNILLTRCPLEAGATNAAIIFLGFLISIPAIILQTSRAWLKLHGYVVFVAAIFTLVMGLTIWFDTLTTRSRLLDVWTAEPAAGQSILQTTLRCCGYFNSTSPLFVTDSFCTSAAVAATKVGCVGPFSVEANNFLDIVFTAAFGCVGVDFALIIAIACLVEDRKEQDRYRFIDEKQGAGGF